MKTNKEGGFLALYHRTPLYVRIIIALLLGIAVGYTLKALLPADSPSKAHTVAGLAQLATIVLKLLSLLATPLIFVAVVQALIKADITGRTAARLLSLLFTNTVVAILVGLVVANIIRPGEHAHLNPAGAPDHTPFKPADLLDKIPANFVDPFRGNEILSIILLAVAIGIALRAVRDQQRRENLTGYRIVEDLLDTGFRATMVILHWIFDLVPVAVFGVVARTVAEKGIGPILSMAWFVVAVLLALFIQVGYYLLRVRFGSWVRPGQFLRGASDALILAFSTASSAATLPVTYSCMKDKIGVRPESASLGVMVGGAFNHDGTALYEAMAALFVAQAMGMHLGIQQQVVVVIMAVFASVGAAGIPEAGLVTMMAVFTALHLPTGYIPLLLPLDWFLDRCRTAINVMGDMSVTCMLDGKTRSVDVADEVNVSVDPAI